MTVNKIAKLEKRQRCFTTLPSILDGAFCENRVLNTPLIRLDAFVILYLTPSNC